MPEVSPENIQNLAKDIEAIRVTFFDAVKGISTASFSAGGLPEAPALERKARDGSTAVATLRDNIDAALTAIVDNLTTSATVYANGEAESAAAGERLNALITNLRKDLPGLDLGDD